MHQYLYLEIIILYMFILPIDLILMTTLSYLITLMLKLPEAGNAYFVSIFNLTYGQFKTTTQREGLIKESANSNSSSNSNAAMTAVLTGQKNVNNAWISTEDNYHLIIRAIIT